MKAIASFLVWVSLGIAASTPALDQARELYQRTEFKAAIELLKPHLQSDAAALALAGKSYYYLGDFKKSQEHFEKAVALDQKSEYYNWLGKAVGRRAETANFLSASRLAVDCRKAFEKAVELDPGNKEALNDLFEFYIQAPGIVGGGFDKASSLANRIGDLDPVEKHFLDAKLAEKKKDFNRAEQHLRRASELAPQQVGRVIDLAVFLAKQGKVSESESVWSKASQNDPKVMFARAQLYIDSKRNLDQAKQLLERYLKASLTPDDPPRAQAEKLLRTASGM